MATKEQIEFMKAVEIEYLDDEVLDTDVIWFERWEGPHTVKGFYHLYSKDGELKDIQTSNILASMGDNRRPTRKPSPLVTQGPASTKGRKPKSVSVPKVKKAKTKAAPKVITKKEAAKKQKSPQKKKVTKKAVSKKPVSSANSDEMRKRALAFLARKKNGK